jgi:uncharacterized protein YdeI (BOF family)
MRKAIGLIAFAAVIGAGAQSYAITPQDPQLSVEPSPSTGGQVIEGKVIRVDADSYVIRDLSGRDVRVYFDAATTKRDPITVGDQVIARFDRPSAPYAVSITRRPSDITAVPTGALPRPQTIEGEILRIYNDSYVIRDLSGREVRLHVDTSTKLDGNLTPGDKVVARVGSPPSDAMPYGKTIYKLNNADSIEGQVVAIDGNTYVVRDTNGVEQRVSADSATTGAKNIVVGDRVVVVRGTTPMAHAESISKR